MAINPYFTEGAGTVGQKDLYEDLIIEALQIYGQNYNYIPREIIRKDELFGEDTFSRFRNAIPLEMYVENNEGFNGGDLFQKFGVEIRDEATFVISQRRWNEVITQSFLTSSTPAIEVLDRQGNLIVTRDTLSDGSTVIFGRQNSYVNDDAALSGTSADDLTRPREGDLIFMPNANAIFEITFVEHEKPFYQLNNLPIYKLTASLFEYGGEDMDLDNINIDESRFATDYILTVESITGFIEGETIIQNVGATNSVTGEIQKVIDKGPGQQYITVSNVRNQTNNLVVFSLGTITGETSGQTTTVQVVAEYDLVGYTDNDNIETEADSITPFDTSNPFGDF